MFKQDFAADLDAAVAGLLPGYSGPPYALVRAGDGEAAILAGRFYQTKADGWRWPGGEDDPTGLRAALLDSLACDAAGWTVGLPCPRHEPQHFRELRPLVRVPQERLTFAKIFSDGNYNRFKAMLPDFDCFTVAGRDNLNPRRATRANLEVWHDWMMRIANVGDDPNLHFVLDVLRDVKKPILVAAGPLAKVVIHRYWISTPPERRQVIIDAGSAIDELVKDRRYRVRAYDRDAQHVWTDEDERAALEPIENR